MFNKCAGPVIEYIDKCKDSLFQIHLKLCFYPLIIEAFVAAAAAVGLILFLFWGESITQAQAGLELTI